MDELHEDRHFKTNSRIEIKLESEYAGTNKIFSITILSGRANKTCTKKIFVKFQ